MTIVESLKKVVKAYGGEESNANTIVEGLRDIVTAMGGSTADGNTVAQVIEDIAAAVPGGGGGGSSDFSTAEVTIVNPSTTLSCELGLPYYYSVDLDDWAGSSGKIVMALEDTETFTVILYKGKAECVISDAYSASFIMASATGDISIDDDSKTYAEITGDGTITLSPAQS